MPAAEPAATPNQKQPPRDSPLKTAILLTISGVALIIAAYYIYQQVVPKNEWLGEISDQQREANFDQVTAEQLLDMPLTDAAGQPVSLRERSGKKHLVIIVTRGSLSSVAASDKGFVRPEHPHICAYCSSQTSGIANRLADFTASEAEVLVVFPVSKPDETSGGAELLQSAGVSDPKALPVLFDLNLNAVDKLKLRAHLARPASFIVDKAGQLRFAYVANQGHADRPSATELLRHLTIINGPAAVVPNPPPESKLD